MRIIPKPEVDRLLPWPELIAALEEVFRLGCEAPLRHHHPVPNGPGATGSLLLMPAWWADRFTGVKIVHVMPANASANLPAVQSSYLLSDGRTGEALALLNGGALTDRRTAASSVLAARFLARPDSRRLLVMGSGRVAEALAACYASAFPLEHIAIWSRRPENAQALARHLRAEGLPAESVDRPDLAAADIIACATLSATPLVTGAAVRPGTHVDLVGAFRPTMRESDGALLARARLVVDTRPGALAEAGDVVQAIAEGAITEAGIAADLAQLCRSEVQGRQSPEEITVFKSVGWAGEDLAAAALAYQRAA